MLAQKCKNGAAGCYRAMTANKGMSHRLLEGSQHSRSRNYDRQSESQSRVQPEKAGGSQKEPGGAQNPHMYAGMYVCDVTKTILGCDRIGWQM